MIERLLQFSKIDVNAQVNPSPSLPPSFVHCHTDPLPPFLPFSLPPLSRMYKFLLNSTLLVYTEAKWLNIHIFTGGGLIFPDSNYKLALFTNSNHQGQTLLLMACRAGDRALFDLLIHDQRVDVNLPVIIPFLFHPIPEEKLTNVPPPFTGCTYTPSFFLLFL